MNRLAGLAVLLLASCGTSSSPSSHRTAAAAAPDLIPRDVLFGNPERANPQISPDGARLAWLAPKDGVLNVWVRTLGKADDRVVTSDARRGIRNYFWQQDSSHLLYMQDIGGDENYH